MYVQNWCHIYMPNEGTDVRDFYVISYSVVLSEPLRQILDFGFYFILYIFYLFIKILKKQLLSPQHNFNIDNFIDVPLL